MSFILKNIEKIISFLGFYLVLTCCIVFILLFYGINSIFLLYWMFKNMLIFLIFSFINIFKDSIENILTKNKIRRYLR